MLTEARATELTTLPPELQRFKPACDALPASTQTSPDTALWHEVVAWQQWMRYLHLDVAKVLLQRQTLRERLTAVQEQLQKLLQQSIADQLPERVGSVMQYLREQQAAALVGVVTACVGDIIQDTERITLLGRRQPGSTTTVGTPLSGVGDTPRDGRYGEGVLGSGLPPTAAALGQSMLRSQLASAPASASPIRADGPLHGAEGAALAPAAGLSRLAALLQPGPELAQASEVHSLAAPSAPVLRTSAVHMQQVLAPLSAPVSEPRGLLPATHGLSTVPSRNTTPDSHSHTSPSTPPAHATSAASDYATAPSTPHSAAAAAVSHAHKGVLQWLGKAAGVFTHVVHGFPGRSVGGAHSEGDFIKWQEHEIDKQDPYLGISYTIFIVVLLGSFMTRTSLDLVHYALAPVKIMCFSSLLLRRLGVPGVTRTRLLALSFVFVAVWWLGECVHVRRAAYRVPVYSSHHSPACRYCHCIRQSAVGNTGKLNAGLIFMRAFAHSFVCVQAKLLCCPRRPCTASYLFTCCLPCWRTQCTHSQYR